MTTFDVFVLILKSLFIVGGMLTIIVLLARREERKRWNNGHCVECGCAWNRAGVGGLYVCSQGHTVWIGWLLPRECRPVKQRID